MTSSDEPQTPPSQEAGRKTALTLLRAAVSLGLLALLFSQVDWGEFFQVLKDFDRLYLISIILLFYLSILLSTIKWQAILEYLGIPESFRSLLSTYMIGVYFGNFLPTSVGGDTYRFIRLRADYPGASDRILTSMLLERGYGYLTLLLVNLVLLAFFWEALRSSQLLFWIEVLIAAGVIALVLAALFARPALGKLAAWRPFLRPLTRLADLLAIKDVRTVAISAGTSLLFVLITGASLALYYRGAGEQVSPVYALFVTTLVGIVGILPLTINGLGLVELIQAALFGLIGIPLETVLAVSLLQRVMRLLLSLPGAALYFRGSTRLAKNPE
jgi:uncharacterized membrane protein YbhN (UPF0104 family)